MKLYKPYERLFCSIETFFTSTGVGGSYSQVIVLIATMQWFNIMTISAPIINNSYSNNFEIIYDIITYGIVIILNLIYFKTNKIIKIMAEYKNLERKKRRIIGISSLFYIILSYVLLIISFNF